MAPSDDSTSGSGGTPVPPRGGKGKGKPKRPTSSGGRSTSGNQAGSAGDTGSAKSGSGAGKPRSDTSKSGASQSGASKSGPAQSGSSRSGSSRSGSSRSGGGRSGGGRSGGGTSPAERRRIALAQQRRHRQTLIAGLAIGLVVVLVAVFIVIKATDNNNKSHNASSPVTTAAGSKSASGSAASGTPVPAATLAKLAKSVSLTQLAAAAANFKLDAYPKTVAGAAITSGGKPEIVYIGAEYCPYCATERWPMVLALSQFGTFTGLHFIKSSADDTSGYDSVPTFSFYKSTYTSPYLTFTPVEEETVAGATLQTPTSQESSLISKYGTNQGQESIPFVYFNGKAVLSGAEYNPDDLIGHTPDDIISSIAGGTSNLAASVSADAGVITSMICQATGGKPGNVCKLFPKPITS